MKDALAGGVTICVVEIVDCYPFERGDCKWADVPKKDYDKNPEEFNRFYSWVLKNPRPVEFEPVKCGQGFFNVPDELIKYVK
jgi:hypothetical protein